MGIFALLRLRFGILYSPRVVVLAIVLLVSVGPQGAQGGPAFKAFPVS